VEGPGRPPTHRSRQQRPWELHLAQEGHLAQQPDDLLDLPDVVRHTSGHREGPWVALRQRNDILDTPRLTQRMRRTCGKPVENSVDKGGHLTTDMVGCEQTCRWGAAVVLFGLGEQRDGDD